MKNSVLGFVPRSIKFVAATLAFALLVGVQSTSPVKAAETLKIGGTGSAIATMRTIGAEFEKLNPGVKVIVPNSLGSGGGIKALMKGKLDIALSSRPLKNKELAAGAIPHTYARTPFVLAVSGEKASKFRLTSRDVQDIFAFRKKTWPDGSTIRVILRPDTDSDVEMLLKWFPSIGPSLEAGRKRRGVIIAISDQEAMDAAESVAGTITTGTLTAMISEKRNLYPLTIDDVAPTMENVKTGTYKWFKELIYVVSRAPSPTAKAFITFLNSPEGARLLSENGNLPVR